MKDNNGKVGQFGTSYPGFYTAVGTLAQHPAGCFLSSGADF
jgi:predicted acyl esterase